MKKLFSVLWMIMFSMNGFAGVRLGIDVLESQRFDLLQGKRVGLICNASSLNARKEPTYEVLKKNGVNLTALFAPEHGLFVNRGAGEYVAQQTWQGIPVHSLYGKTRSPTNSMLANVDVILFDVQDIGVRVFTYISTMQLSMKASYANGKEFVVLDRPNPIGFYPPQGFTLDSAYRSFLGYVAVPFVHGLTVGEIAALIKTKEMPLLKLTVVEMEGYNKEKFFYDDSPFTPPSPNLTSPESLICYTVTVLLEATNISEGRGTDMPFEKIGAPFIRGDALARSLQGASFKGFDIQSISFIPQAQMGKATKPKYEGKYCEGIYLKITDKRKIKPFEAAVALLIALKKDYPNDFKINNEDFFDKLAGTNLLRKALNEGKTVSDILALITHLTGK